MSRNKKDGPPKIEKVAKKRGTGVREHARAIVKNDKSRNLCAWQCVPKLLFFVSTRVEGFTTLLKTASRRKHDVGAQNRPKERKALLLTRPLSPAALFWSRAPGQSPNVILSQRDSTLSNMLAWSLSGTKGVDTSP